MFDKTIIHRTEHVPYEKTVTINRAPTDESIALLNEMQKKTLDNIVETIKVNDNTINAAVVYFINRADFNGFNFVAKFTFNGKEHKLEGHIDRHELNKDLKYGSQQVALALAKALCFLIAENVVNEAPGLREAINNVWV